MSKVSNVLQDGILLDPWMRPLTGQVQLRRAEDSRLGSNWVFASCSLTQFRRAVLLLAAVVLTIAGRKCSATPAAAAARAKKFVCDGSLEQAVEVFFKRVSEVAGGKPVPMSNVELLIPIFDAARQAPEGYFQLLSLDPDGPAAREIFMLMHDMAYSWSRWYRGELFDTAAFGERAMKQSLRGLQSFFKEAAIRSDCFCASSSSQRTAARILKQNSYEKLASLTGPEWMDEWDMLNAWVALMQDKTARNVLYPAVCLDA